MAKPKKKKKQQRAVKNQKVLDSKGRPAFSEMLPEVTVTDRDPNRTRAYERSLYNKNPMIKDMHKSTTKAAKIIGEAAMFHPSVPTARGLKWLNQYRKSLSKPAFDLIKGKIVDKAPYGVIANLIEGAIAAFQSSKNEEETPRKLYSGGSVKPIKRKK